MQYWTIENNIIVCYLLHLCLLFFQIMKDNSNLLFLRQAVTYKHIPNSWYFYSPQIKIELNKEQLSEQEFLVRYLICQDYNHIFQKANTHLHSFPIKSVLIHLVLSYLKSDGSLFNSLLYFLIK